MKVWLFTPKVARLGDSRKLSRFWTGPWIVCSPVHSEVYVRITPDPSWTNLKYTKVVSVDRLKPYLEPAKIVPATEDDDIHMEGDEFAEAIRDTSRGRENGSTGRKSATAAKATTTTSNAGATGPSSAADPSATATATSTTRIARNTETNSASTKDYRTTTNPSESGTTTRPTQNASTKIARYPRATTTAKEAEENPTSSATGRIRTSTTTIVIKSRYNRRRKPK